MKRTPTLTISGFRTWLTHQHKSRTFTNRSSTCCPAARYLQKIRGPGAAVYGIHYRLPVKGSYKRSEHTSPEWLKRFVSAIDRLPGGFVTAETAREIFFKVAYRKA